MKRPIFAHVDGFSGSATTYASFNGKTPNTFAGSGRQPWLVAGVLRDWRIALAAAPGSGKSFTFTIRINGADSAMSVTIADLATSGSYAAGDISVSALDTVEIKSVPSGSPSSASVSMSVEFDSTSHVDSCYGGGSGTMIGGQTRYTTPFRVENFTSGVPSGDIVAVAGAITGLATCCATSFAGGSYTTSIYLNGVNQDGSGGTVDTLHSHSVSSSLTAVTSKSFTLPVAAGDLVYVEVIAPSLGTTTFISLGFQLTATTAGESQITGTSFGSLSANNFHRLGVATDNGSVGEGVSVLQTVGLTEFSLSDLWWGLTAAPVGVTSRTVTVRQNSADSALAATVSGANTVSSDLVDSIPFVTGDTFTIKHTVSGSPAAASGKWSAVITVDIVAPTIVGTSIFGEEGHVAGLSRVHLVNLDGTPRTLNDPALEGTAYIGGDLIVTGETTVEDLVINGAFTLPADSVTNTELANMAQATIKGRASGAGTGDPTDLSANQVSTILDAATDPFLRTSAAGGAGTLDGLSDVIITAPATGEVLKYDGTDWVNDTDATGAGSSEWTTIVSKATDETVTSSTTLQSDDELFFAVGANERWIYEVNVLAIPNAGGLKVGLRFPATPTAINYGIVTVPTGAFVASGPFTADAVSGASIGSTATTMVWVKLVGLLHNAGNSGTVRLWWTQNASNGTGAIIKAGSYVAARLVS